MKLGWRMGIKRFHSHFTLTLCDITLWTGCNWHSAQSIQCLNIASEHGFKLLHLCSKLFTCQYSNLGIVYSSLFSLQDSLCGLLWCLVNISFFYLNSSRSSWMWLRVCEQNSSLSEEETWFRKWRFVRKWETQCYSRSWRAKSCAGRLFFFILFWELRFFESSFSESSFFEEAEVIGFIGKIMVMG